jgi:hypothetical protein
MRILLASLWLGLLICAVAMLAMFVLSPLEDYIEPISAIA